MTYRAQRANRARYTKLHKVVVDGYELTVPGRVVHGARTYGENRNDGRLSPTAKKIVDSAVPVPTPPTELIHDLTTGHRCSER